MEKGSRGHITITLTKEDLVWLEIVARFDGWSPKQGSVSSFASSIVKQYIASHRKDVYIDGEEGKKNA